MAQGKKVALSHSPLWLCVRERASALLAVALEINEIDDVKVNRKNSKENIRMELG